MKAVRIRNLPKRYLRSPCRKRGEGVTDHAAPDQADFIML
jgi:hypothetical protein